MENLDFGEEAQKGKGGKYKLWHLVLAFLLGAIIVAAAFLAPSFGSQGIILKRNFDAPPVIQNHNKISPKINVRPQDINMNSPIKGMDPGLVNIGTPDGN